MENPKVVHITNSSRLTEAAYSAYGEDAKWLTWNGNPMPQWDQLNDAVKSHWIAAVEFVLLKQSDYTHEMHLVDNDINDPNVITVASP